MDQELKAKWVTALRSGEYKQTKYKLHRKGSNNFCCLGVLCKVFGLELTEDGEDVVSGPVGASYEACIYPLFSSDKVVADEQITPLIRLNDEGEPFSAIADYIEKNL